VAAQGRSAGGVRDQTGPLVDRLALAPLRLGDLRAMMAGSGLYTIVRAAEGGVLFTLYAEGTGS
jgi:hypothetical protein